MISHRWAVTIPLALLFAALGGWAQDAPPPADTPGDEIAPPPLLARYDFEDAEVGPAWSAVDAEATLAIASDPGDVASGKGALELTYQARRGAYQQLTSNAFGSDSAGALALKIKASSPTSLSLGLQEANGAMYQGLLSIGAGGWVSVEIPLRDLLLSKNGDDEPGATPGQISGFFLADLANLPGETGQALGFKEGEQKIWVDDVALIDDPKTPPRGRVEELGDEWVTIVDGFETDVMWALPIRQAKFTHTKGAPKAKGTRAMEITYALNQGRWVGCVLAPPGRLDLSAATKFRMLAHTDLNARLVVVVEERGGTKYETATKLPTDGKWQEVILPLDEFLADAGAADQDQKVTPSEIHRVIVLIDTFDADVKPGGKGSIVIDDVGLVMSQAPQTE